MDEFVEVMDEMRAACVCIVGGPNHGECKVCRWRTVIAAALEAAREDACVERCKRRHPHTKLTLTRDIAPDTGWHWSVTLPDGHLYGVSHGRMVFQEALASLLEQGVDELQEADDMVRAAIDQARGKAGQEVGK